METHWFMHRLLNCIQTLPAWKTPEMGAETPQSKNKVSEVCWESYSLSITGRETETSHSSQTLVTFSHYWVITIISRSQHVLIQREQSRTAKRRQTHIHAVYKLTYCSCRACCSITDNTTVGDGREADGSKQKWGGGSDKRLVRLEGIPIDVCSVMGSCQIPWHTVFSLGFVQTIHLSTWS